MEDQSFSAHRIVLAASIPYFYAMFTHNMVESKKRDIVMKGIEPKYVYYNFDKKYLYKCMYEIFFVCM